MTTWTVCSPPGSFVYVILQVRILEWVAISFSRGSSQSRDRTQLSHITGRLFTNWATSSGQFSCSFVSNSLQPQGPQHARPPCPSSTPRVYSNSCPLSWWWHPTISASVTPFSSCLQSFLASRSFQMSQFFASWPKYWSFSFSISPSKEYSGLISFRMDWLDLLEVQGTLKSSPTPQFRSISSLALSFLYSQTLISIHDYWKNHSFD